MPFVLADLDRIRVRVGMGTKSLREMSDTQFTAWPRARRARGRPLNDLDQSGFFIPDVMGVPTDVVGPDRATLSRTLGHLNAVREHLQDVDAAVAELGEFDPRVNMRASIHGAIELIEQLRGAFEHGLPQP